MSGSRRMSMIVATGVLALLGCERPLEVNLSGLESQGDAGAVAIEMMQAHGGAAAFLGLVDVEHDVQVERHDANGVFLGTFEELHRFQAAPPRRYVLRRSGPRVAELGLAEGEAWVRVDGVLQDRSAVEDVAWQELASMSVLARAPFSLADPGVQVALMPDALDEAGRPLRRLAAEFPALARHRSPGRFVFFQHRDSGRLARVLFQPPDSSLATPLRLARAGQTVSIGKAVLVAIWEVSAADAEGHVTGLPDLRWQARETRTGNGFTDDLYRAGRRSR